MSHLERGLFSACLKRQATLPSDRTLLAAPNGMYASGMYVLVSSLMRLPRCADGTSLLSHCEDNAFRLYDLYVAQPKFHKNILDDNKPSVARIYPQTPPFLHTLDVCRSVFTAAKHFVTPYAAPPMINAQQTFRQPSPVLDYVWYPTATPMDPASFCFMASVRECPVKLLDASDGRVNIFPPPVRPRSSLCII